MSSPAGHHGPEKVLLLTTPFTQLNTPYPATAFLKGFLNSRDINSVQADLGIETILELFSAGGLTSLFEVIDLINRPLPANCTRMVQLRESYLNTIEPVISFLQGACNELAYPICSRTFLPEASRFSQLEYLDDLFGDMGLHDKAKHLATLYLEDIADLIVETADAGFGFSRYAERLGRSASSFDLLEERLTAPEGFIDRIYLRILREKMISIKPELVAISVPFPGNLYSALRCGKWIKEHHPNVKVAIGGGFVNTELRSLTDARVFKYLDFITLDDGEIPLLHLIELTGGCRTKFQLKRTLMLHDGRVVYHNESPEPDVPHNLTGTPDYSGLPLEKYISVLEMANPMHRLWSDGRWNKLMLAHGCYWAKCSFCDVSLDYIKRYEAVDPRIIVDRMETLIGQTGNRSFHFVDEAAPPVLLRQVALEIIRRNLVVVWWTNIRFEKSFTRDLCRLLKKSGCIAVSGGLEVASDRILRLINKGVTIPQVARVAHHFTGAGIMVHAYLMYGFPTQSARETIDSLEVVRQLFLNGVVNSGFWHQFAMTVHSPVGMDPGAFGIEKEDRPAGTFANNDLVPIDRKGCDHEIFGDGLTKALYNYMHGVGLDFRLQDWFDFGIPVTTIAPRYIRDVLQEDQPEVPQPGSRLLWFGPLPVLKLQTRIRKGKKRQLAALTMQTTLRQFVVQTPEETGKQIVAMITMVANAEAEPVTFSAFRLHFETQFSGRFDDFWNSEAMRQIRETGLLVV